MKNKRLKVATVIGTRPEIIRLSRVLARLDQTCEHVMIHTGQNYDYELNQIFFDDLGIRKPDYFLDSAKGSNSAAQTIGNLIGSVDEVLETIAPDALLVSTGRFGVRVSESFMSMGLFITPFVGE